MRNRIFFKLLAAFLVVIVAAAIIFDVMIGGAWEASLRSEIERNLIQKTQLLAHRVEADHSGRSLTNIAAEESKAAQSGWPSCPLHQRPLRAVCGRNGHPET